MRSSFRIRRIQALKSKIGDPGSALAQPYFTDNKSFSRQKIRLGTFGMFS